MTSGTTYDQSAMPISAHEILDFRSDNVGTVAPEMIEAILAANHGDASSYGSDDLTAAVQRRYAELFETDVAVFAVPTGTAANATCLSACAPPWGAIYCTPEAHAHTSECSATEFFSSGAKFIPVAAEHGRIDPDALDAALRQGGRNEVHRSQPATVTVTQATELGTVYSLAQLDAIAAVTHAHSLVFHMDGSRFAGAVASLGCSPAEASWRRGVDILSFGITKNGGLLCDAIIVFRHDLAETLKYRLRRSGYVWSKMRFASAQLLAYVHNDLWLRLARRANALAARLAAGLMAAGVGDPVVPVEANEVFLALGDRAAAAFERSGIRVQPRIGGVVRMVCRADMADVDIDRCIALARDIKLGNELTKRPLPSK